MTDRGRVLTAFPPVATVPRLRTTVFSGGSRRAFESSMFPAVRPLVPSAPIRHGGNSMRTALYARVSTLNGQHPEMQLSELREYGARRGWQIISEYVDEGVSGSRERRPQLDRLMSDAHRRKFDLIAVWKIDRFGRSLKHLVNALADLDSIGVAFVSS